MLTRNYTAIADRTQRPFQQGRSVRSTRNWAYSRAHSKPGAVRYVPIPTAQPEPVKGG